MRPRSRLAAFARPGAILCLLLTAAHSARAQDDTLASVEVATDALTDKVLELSSRLGGLLPLLGVALLVVVVAWFLARWIESWTWLYSRLSPNPFLQQLLGQATRLAVFASGLLLALELLDWTALVGAALGTAGVMGIALGFAFRDLVENYIASILLSLRRPFSPDDHVVIGSHEGKVVRLTSRATILMTLDGNHLRIPNADVFKSPIINYSVNPERRFDFAVDIGTTDSITHARDVGVACLQDMPGVLADPAPASAVEKLGDSSVTLRFTGWVNQEQSSFGKVRSEAIRRVKITFETAGVSMPEPAYQVRIVGAPGEVGIEPVDGTSGPSDARPEPVHAAADEAMDVAADLSPDTHLERQIADDRSKPDAAKDLLDLEAPSEL